MGRTSQAGRCVRGYVVDEEAACWVFGVVLAVEGNEGLIRVLEHAPLELRETTWAVCEQRENIARVLLALAWECDAGMQDAYRRLSMAKEHPVGLLVRSGIMLVC